MGSFEFIREGGRRPYIIHDYMYSTSILKKDFAEAQKKGVLQSARWVKNRTITPANRMAAGAELNMILCLPCHSTGGPLKDMLPIAKRFTPEGMESFILGLGNANPYMPPFAGTREEAAVLAEYLTTEYTPGFAPAAKSIQQIQVSPSPFAPETSGYVLLGGSTFGSILFSNPDESGIDLSYGAPVLRAQLILRDESPRVVMDGATISFAMKTGKGIVKGKMEAQDEDGYFEATLAAIPSPPTPYQPFLIAELTAEIEGKVVAVTQAKIGVSTEIGCRNCHGGSWSQEGRSGMSKETAAGILAAHDKWSKTNLSADFNNGKTVVCSSCHGDVIRGTEGKPGVLNLSAAIHGYHAGFLAEKNSCGLCHSTGDTGSSHSFDGIHKQLELSCENCHGTLADNAVSLLKQEQDKGQAKKLLSLLQNRTETDFAEIQPRSPWIMEPDCLTCHIDFQPPETENAFNTWTANKNELFHNRMGERGAILCSSCHGQAHSIYPAANRYGTTVGALQPMQYQNNPYPIAANKGCAVCHTTEMEADMHHPGSLATFRNQ